MTQLFRVARVGAVIAALSGGAALAHPRLVQTSPGVNATVPSASRIDLRFSEPLIGAMTGAEVVMTGMPGKPRAAPVRVTALTPMLSSDRRTFSLAARRALPAGSYRVAWHAVSVDTHRVQGSFGFAVK